MQGMLFLCKKVIAFCESVFYFRSYHLYIVQHPLTGAECGSLSRIPLAPPLFVQLIVKDSSGKIIPACSFFFSLVQSDRDILIVFSNDDLPFLVAIISLHPADSHNSQDSSSNRELNGTTVAGPSNLLDMHNNHGVYFIFPDVGIHRCGRWKLHVSLVRIAQYVFSPTFSFPVLSKCPAVQTRCAVDSSMWRRSSMYSQHLDRSSGHQAPAGICCPK